MGESAAEVLADPTLRDCIAQLVPDMLARYPRSWIETVEFAARYSGYEEKEARLVGRMERSDRLRLPADFDYRKVLGLSTEAINPIGK